MIVKRAREHRLYTQDGKRIIDLSMGFGRGVLGHRPNGVSLALKNTIERGLYSEYQSIYFTRLNNLLLKMFPEYSIVTYLNSPKELNFKDIIDPIRKEYKKDLCYEAAYWRPFIETPNANNLIILYPLPGLTSTTIIISKNAISLESQIISTIILSGILKSMFDYNMAKETFKTDVFTPFSQIKNSTLLPPYLIFNMEDSHYKELCNRALESDILLNTKEQINILPMEYSQGELKKILGVLGE